MTSTHATSIGHHASRSPKGRRRRPGLVGVVGLVGGIVAALAVASPAAAAQPTVVEEGTYDNLYDVPAEAFPCGVKVTFHEVGSYRITAFVDRDGTVLRQQAHIGGTTTVTSAFGEIVNHWRQSGRLTPDGTLTWSGNSYNIHAGAGGVLVNQSGHWIIDDHTGEVLSTAGPQEDPDVNIDEICAVLAP